MDDQWQMPTDKEGLLKLAEKWEELAEKRQAAIQAGNVRAPGITDQQYDEAMRFFKAHNQTMLRKIQERIAEQKTQNQGGQAR